ncbi:hypothetical protein AB5N19_13517 [Seiridium cardinale]
MASDPKAWTASHSPQSQKLSLLRDQQSCVPLINVLSDGDLLILLSPAVASSPDEHIRDHFEPFGRALAARHAWVRHVPYTPSRGIAGIHVAFIKKAKVVIFVVAGADISGQDTQIDMAAVARSMAEHRPFVVVACRDEQDLDLDRTDFPTVLRLPGYAPAELEQAAAVLFGDVPPPMEWHPDGQKLLKSPRLWKVEALPDSLAQYDISPILELWNQCLPHKFHMNRFTLQNLLDRDGFGKHYVVKMPETGETIGFCATYTTWAFSDPEYLVGSLAVLLVKPAYRKLGIGMSLYTYAKDLLTRTRGVKRLQLGSTFPRLLSGVPRELASQDWFRRRGWDLDSQAPGRGREVCDWILKIEDWPSGGSDSISEGYTFRQCSPEGFSEVLEFVRAEGFRNQAMGLFEEYKWSRDSTHDIVVCLHGSTIVAAALTYMANSGTTADNDLPWARRLGPDVGGITCICIAEDNSILQRNRNSVMIRLLGTCIELLQSYGMQEVFLDGVRGGDQGFQDLGFRKWALYRDVWEPM